MGPGLCRCHQLWENVLFSPWGATLNVPSPSTETPPQPWDGALRVHAEPKAQPVLVGLEGEGSRVCPQSCPGIRERRLFWAAQASSSFFLLFAV